MKDTRNAPRNRNVNLGKGHFVDFKKNLRLGLNSRDLVTCMADRESCHICNEDNDFDSLHSLFSGINQTSVGVSCMGTH